MIDRKREVDSDAVLLAILMPVYNDWDSLIVLTNRICSAVPRSVHLHFIVVDDGSQTIPLLGELATIWSSENASIVRLRRNGGHQRAIAVGLRHAVTSVAFDAVVIMDSDGEDSSAGVVALFDAWKIEPTKLVVARRGRRSETGGFRIGYRVYRAVFRFVTGLSLPFGNFALLPREAAERVAQEETLWSNFAATVVRLGLPRREVVVDRGNRINGQSHMNVYNLINHGLGAMAVFSDRIFIRVLLASTYLVGVALVVMGAILSIRFGTHLSTPGWATIAAGVALLFTFQILAISILTTFVMLQQRINMLPVIAQRMLDEITEVIEL